MRKALSIAITAHLSLALFLVYCVWDLLMLPLTDWKAVALHEDELNPPQDKLDRPMIIPKIIHQTYKTDKVPEIWKKGQQRCIDLHPDYQYILWTDEMARKLVAEEYPWFLDTWDSYRYPIGRADAIRYFVLVHYGGVYIDLDDGCERRLDPLLTMPAFARLTTPTGISNDVIGAVPGHPFFVQVVNSLQHYNRNWVVPYITIMFSTGPLFLSVILEKFLGESHPAESSVRIILPKDYKGHPNSFFAISLGNSWHTEDAKFIKALGRHIPLAVFSGFMVAGLVFLSEWYLFQWCARKNTTSVRRTSRFSKLLSRFQHQSRPRKDSNLPANVLLLSKEDVDVAEEV